MLATAQAQRRKAETQKLKKRVSFLSFGFPVAEISGRVSVPPAGRRGTGRSRHARQPRGDGEGPRAAEVAAPRRARRTAGKKKKAEGDR